MTVFLFDGRDTGLSEVRDPIIPASVSRRLETRWPTVGNRRGTTVVSGAQYPAMGVRLSLAALCDIICIK